MRVVVDTNIFVSGFRTQGNPKLIVQMAFARRFALVTNGHIVGELRRVLPRKLKWSSQMVDAAVANILEIADVVSAKQRVIACDDPDDDRILEAAVAGHADCIVTGDSDLLRMKAFEGIEIITAREFLDRFDDGAEIGQAKK